MPLNPNVQRLLNNKLTKKEPHPVNKSEVTPIIKPPKGKSTSKVMPKPVPASKPVPALKSVPAPKIVPKPMVKQVKKTIGKSISNSEKKRDGLSPREVHDKFRKKYNVLVGSEFIDSGSIGINRCLGGGLPEGKISEWCSKSGLGKTTIACAISRVVCEGGGTVLYIDAEHALNDSLIEGVGLTPYYDKTFLLYQIRTFSDIEEVMDTYLKLPKPPKLIIIDSITSMVTSKIVTGKMKLEDVEPGWQSRLMSLFFLKYKGLLPRIKTHLMLINQQRVKIKLFGPSLTGSAGGNPLLYFCDIRVKFYKKADIKRGEAIIGADVYMESAKNKFTLAFVKHMVCIIFGQGMSNLRACTYIFEKEKLIKKSGSYYVVNIKDTPETIYGRVGVEKYFKDNQQLVTEILRKKGYL